MAERLTLLLFPTPDRYELIDEGDRGGRQDWPFTRSLIDGAGGDDWIVGGYAADSIHGNTGDDRLYGWVDDDFVFGGPGADLIFGNEGNDSLFGGLLRDTLRGGEGADILDGGRADDRLEGGSSVDLFRFTGNFGKDTVVDFEGGSDRLDMRAFRALVDSPRVTFDDFIVRQAGRDTIVLLDVDHDGLYDRSDLDGDDRLDRVAITLLHTRVAEVEASWFLG